MIIPVYIPDEVVRGINIKVNYLSSFKDDIIQVGFVRDVQVSLVEDCIVGNPSVGDQGLYTISPTSNEDIIGDYAVFAIVPVSIVVYSSYVYILSYRYSNPSYQIRGIYKTFQAIYSITVVVPYNIIDTKLLFQVDVTNKVIVHSFLGQDDVYNI